MDWNTKIIEEFRENNGQVGGMFEGAPMVVITTAGARSGKPHTNPAIYRKDGDRYLVFGSNNGKPKHPDWYHNILGIPQVTMEIGTPEGRVKQYSTRAVVLEGEERDRMWEEQCALNPAFAAYQEQTTRQIPVVALYPLDLSATPERARFIGEQLVVHHRELRAELATARAAVERALGGAPDEAVAQEPAQLAEQMRKHCLSFCYGMQMHHTREDGSFTEFERQFPGLASVFVRLREEHAVVEHALARFEELLGRATGGTVEETTEVRAELDRVIADMDEHFAYEEENLIPALNGLVG